MRQSAIVLVLATKPRRICENVVGGIYLVGAEYLPANGRQSLMWAKLIWESGNMDGSITGVMYLSNKNFTICSVQ